MKTSAERTVEALTWAAVVMWLGFALIAHILNYVFLVVMVLGMILLSSAIYQRSRGWHTSLSIWIFGIWMAVFSVLETVSALFAASNNTDGLAIDLWVYLGVALLSMGVAVILRTINSQRLIGLGNGDEGTMYETGNRPPMIPRPVQDNLSSGWTDPYPGHSETNYDPRRGGQPGQTGYSTGGWNQPPSEQPTYSTGGWNQPPSEQPTYHTGAAGGQNPPGWDQGWQQPPPQQPGQEWNQGWQQQPPQQPGQGWDQGWQQQPPQQPGQGDYHTGWGSPQYGTGNEYSPWEEPQRPMRPTERPVQRPRSAPQHDQLGDLESRVEDIIRRSRERRASSQSDEDLPY